MGSLFSQKKANNKAEWRINPVGIRGITSFGFFSNKGIKNSYSIDLRKLFNGLIGFWMGFLVR
jgi:hypothetical protein